jgi:hypothetical protein
MRRVVIRGQHRLMDGREVEITGEENAAKEKTAGETRNTESGTRK